MKALPCAFVLADALYGPGSQFRRMLEKRGQVYVLAIRSNHVLRFLEEWRFVQTDPATLVGDLEAQAWQPLSAGEGAKGPHLYGWVRLPLNWETEDSFARWLLVRRSLRDPDAVASYFAYRPAETTLAELAAAAGLRWTIEECCLRAKDDLGLDHCEARYEPGHGCACKECRTKEVQPFKSQPHDAEILVALHDAGNPVSVPPGLCRATILSIASLYSGPDGAGNASF
ncbi:transposase [Shinella sp. CPCC 101442]|uniref:transposase n=1 Tax=Shinella sp. CPCC 101442 TaxID=2932265 RepID=UPI002152B470|nr:transposase [Shinella sp. CPCC 101442]